MLKNRCCEFTHPINKGLKFDGVNYSIMDNVYKGFYIYSGVRWLGGDKFKKSYIALNGNVCIGSFSKLRGLLDEIDLFLK